MWNLMSLFGAFSNDFHKDRKKIHEVIVFRWINLQNLTIFLLDEKLRLCKIFLIFFLLKLCWWHFTGKVSWFDLMSFFFKFYAAFWLRWTIICFWINFSFELRPQKYHGSGFVRTKSWKLRKIGNQCAKCNFFSVIFFLNEALIENWFRTEFKWRLPVLLNKLKTNSVWRELGERQKSIFSVPTRTYKIYFN